MKNLTGLLGFLTAVATPSLAGAHVGTIATDTSQHFQLHLFDGSVVLLVIAAGIFLLRRQNE